VARMTVNVAGQSHAADTSVETDILVEIGGLM
jgi:hypothetical protein